MIDHLLDELLDKREGEKVTVDASGRSRYGISERWHPDAWKNGPPNRAAAKAIYQDEYVVQPHFNQVVNEDLAEHLVDIGVLSGPKDAVRALQRALRLPVVDGALGPKTLLAVNAYPDVDQLHNLLVKERVLLLARAAQARPAELVSLAGWMIRALSFLRP